MGGFLSDSKFKAYGLEDGKSGGGLGLGLTAPLSQITDYLGE